MKLSIVCLLLVLSATALAWSPFKHSTTPGVGVVPTSNGNSPLLDLYLQVLTPPDLGRSIDIESQFNPKELLESRKTEFYSEALLRLERLEDQPLCHRIAAQLLMKNCHGLDGIDKQTYQLNSDHTQKHHIEAFTASLTVCEMEEVSFSVPESCLPFSSASIFHHARQIGYLKVSHEQTIDCKTAIHQNPSNQHIWSNFVTSATVFCRAARSELENDQHILLHKELVQNMAKFSQAVHEDLEMIRKKMADNARAADSYLETALHNVNDWTAKLKHAFQSASKDIEDVDSAMDSIAKKSRTAAHMMNQFVKSMYESTAEVSAEQEKALTVGTTQVQRQMDIISHQLRTTEDGLAAMVALMNTLAPMVVSLGERVGDVETQSQAAQIAISNATEALSAHVEQLDQLTGKASTLNEQLGHANENIQSWREALSRNGLIPNWTIRAGIPVGMVAVGNFGHALSLVSNVQIGLAGLVIGQIVIIFRHPMVWATCQRGLDFVNFLNSFQSPSAVTHKARMGKESVVATPVQFDSPSIADSNDPRHEMI
ncbi:hypothetical protein BKA65DRAFT_585543 [Rhexocercosporidium sp. MPI-PUGE-AT-0058]|nr:hypothetical protein BKA65DRAFT_585543 [Rhexocercosporidium sp. MPI-PUGE-AT-0058]